jgi:hypothetical protein
MRSSSQTCPPLEDVVHRPKSPARKTVSRRTSWKHGILSEVMAIDGFDDPLEWEALLDGLRTIWSPKITSIVYSPRRIAIALWKLRRLESHQAVLTARSTGGAEGTYR